MLSIILNHSLKPFQKHCGSNDNGTVKLHIAYATLILSDFLCVARLGLSWLTSVKPPEAVKTQRANDGNQQLGKQC